jgi:plasmid stabilization system protein ParE
MTDFDRQVELVANHPEIHPLPHLRELATKGYRAFAVGKHLALYKIDDSSVVISHIFHRSRDYARLV